MQARNYKSSLWNMEYVACGGAFECPRICRTSIHVYLQQDTIQCCNYMYMYIILYVTVLLYCICIVLYSTMCTGWLSAKPSTSKERQQLIRQYIYFLQLTLFSALRLSHCPSSSTSFFSCNSFSVLCLPRFSVF